LCHVAVGIQTSAIVDAALDAARDVGIDLLHLHRNRDGRGFVGAHEGDRVEPALEETAHRVRPALDEVVVLNRDDDMELLQGLAEIPEDASIAVALGLQGAAGVVTMPSMRAVFIRA
jgi:hypothetical protein